MNSTPAAPLDCVTPQQPGSAARADFKDSGHNDKQQAAAPAALRADGSSKAAAAAQAGGGVRDAGTPSGRPKALSAHSRSSGIAPDRVQSAIEELRQHMGKTKTLLCSIRLDRACVCCTLPQVDSRGARLCCHDKEM